MSVSVLCQCLETEESARSLQLELQTVQAAVRVLRTRLGYSEEQPVLRTAEPPLQPEIILILVLLPKKDSKQTNK